MAYVDGVVIPVPHDRKEAYRELAAGYAQIFREHGATQVVECWGADLRPGKTTDFFMAVKAEEGENIVLSWITWPDKATRDAGWDKVMADGRMRPPAEPLFDGQRMFWGGFEVIVDTAA